jgi:hypothetical protein
MLKEQDDLIDLVRHRIGERRAAFKGRQGEGVVEAFAEVEALIAEHVANPSSRLRA